MPLKFLCKHRVNLARHAVEIFFCRADGAVAINRPGQLRADVGIGQRTDAGRQQTLAGERFHPQAPIVTAHYGHGVGDFLFVGGRQDHIGDFLRVQFDGAAGEDLADGLERGTVDRAGARVGALGRSQAVDHEIQRRQAFTHDGQGLPFALVGKGVTVDAGGKQGIALGPFVKRDGVVVAGASGFFAVRRPLEEDAERVRAATPGGGDARRQSIAGGGADDQHVARRAPGQGIDAAGDLGNLPFDVAAAALGMGVDADEAARAALDHLFRHMN